MVAGIAHMEDDGGQFAERYFLRRLGGDGELGLADLGLHALRCGERDPRLALQLPLAGSDEPHLDSSLPSRRHRAVLPDQDRTRTIVLRLRAPALRSRR